MGSVEMRLLQRFLNEGAGCARMRILILIKRWLNGSIIAVCRLGSTPCDLITQHWPDRPFLLPLQAGSTLIIVMLWELRMLKQNVSCGNFSPVLWKTGYGSSAAARSQEQHAVFIVSLSFQAWCNSHSGLGDFKSCFLPFDSQIFTFLRLGGIFRAERDCWAPGWHQNVFLAACWGVG